MLGHAKIRPMALICFKYTTMNLLKLIEVTKVKQLEGDIFYRKK